MIEEIIRLIKQEYPIWRRRKNKEVEQTNQKIKEEIELYNRIHDLLQNEKVKEFAETIGYKEKKPCSYVELKDSLYDFLSCYMIGIDWDSRMLKRDKYPIYCFIESRDPIYSARTGKRIANYHDIYWDLQRRGNSITCSDSNENGQKREKFRIKNVDNIIYPPEGESFTNSETFYRIQTEYVEEALKTNQANAKKLLLQKYGKRN